MIGNPKVDYPQLDSTNAEAKRLIDGGKATDGLVITTDLQTQGRGQYGKTWNSTAHQNVLMSIIVLPHFLKIEEQFDLNICTSLVVADVISDYCDNVSIKWPNDIYVNHQKIAGILIQNIVQYDRINFSIIGIGINVNQEEWPIDVPNATSVKKLTNRITDKNDIIDELCIRMDRGYEELKNCPGKMRISYCKRLYKLEELSLFKRNGSQIEGIIKGVDQIGRLIVRTKSEVNVYNHGEISLII